MVQINLNLLHNLAKKKAEEINKERKDVQAIYLVGSVAREILKRVPVKSNVYAFSDLDLVVILSGKQKSLFTYNKSPELPLTGYCITYYSEDYFKHDRIGNWHIQDKLSNWLIEAIPLYDPKNKLPYLQKKYTYFDLSTKTKILTEILSFAKLDLSDAFTFYEKEKYLFCLWSLRRSYDKYIDALIITNNRLRFSPKVDIYYLSKNEIEFLNIIHSLIIQQSINTQEKRKIYNTLIKLEKMIKNLKHLT